MRPESPDPEDGGGERPPGWLRFLVTLLLTGPERGFLLGDLEEGWARRRRRGMSRLRVNRWMAGQGLRSARDLWISRIGGILGFGKGRNGMRGWVEDLGFAARSFRHGRGFALAAVATLALGIGATTALFSVVSSVLLEPLPFPESDRLVSVWTVADGDPFNNSPRSVGSWIEHGLFEGMYGRTGIAGLIVEGRSGGRERVEGVRVGPGFGEVLRVPPHRGRYFRPDERGPDAPPVAVLTWGFWQERFGGDPAAVGVSLQIDGEAHEVIGVTPPGFTLPGHEDARILLPLDADLATGPADMHFLGATARLLPGESIESTRARLEAHWTGYREAHADAVNPNLRPYLETLHQDTVGGVGGALWILLSATGLLLLMACANVSTLILARASTRADEWAIRGSLGAGRGRIVRQVLLEAAILSAVAGVTGLGLAWATVRFLPRVAPAGLPRIDEVAIDPGVLGFVISVSVLAALLAGLLPALRTARRAPADVLRGSGRGGTDDIAGVGLRNLLVGFQIAVASVLLISAGLLGRSFSELLAVDPGYRLDGVLVAQVDMPDDAYPDRGARARYFQEAQREAIELPSIVSATGALAAPMTDLHINLGVWTEGQERPAPGRGTALDLSIVTGSYFETLGIELRDGRTFRVSDDMDATPVLILSDSAAAELFPGERAVGRQIAIDFGGSVVWREVVGVVTDVRQQSPMAPHRPTMYLPIGQFAQPGGVILARYRGEASTAVDDFREALVGVDPLVPVTDVRTLKATRARAIAEPRFYALLMGLFSVAAAVLSAVGLLGVLSYAVTRRTREIGVRLAFGAKRTGIVGMVVRDGLRVAAIGLVVGMIGAGVAGRFLEGLLFGVEANDPATFVLIGIVVALVSAGSAAVPAFRASRLDPVTALRSD